MQLWLLLVAVYRYFNVFCTKYVTGFDPLYVTVCQDCFYLWNTMKLLEGVETLSLCLYFVCWWLIVEFSLYSIHSFKELSVHLRSNKSVDILSYCLMSGLQWLSTLMGGKKVKSVIWQSVHALHISKHSCWIGGECEHSYSINYPHRLSCSITDWANYSCYDLWWSLLSLWYTFQPDICSQITNQQLLYLYFLHLMTLIKSNTLVLSIHYIEWRLVSTCGVF